MARNMKLHHLRPDNLLLGSVTCTVYIIIIIIMYCDIIVI